MEIPVKIKMYCPKCNAHTEHKLKEFKSKGKKRPFARRHTRRVNEKLKHGYGARLPGTKAVKKQSKRLVALAECTVCHRKVYYTTRTRMKKATIAK